MRRKLYTAILTPAIIVAGVFTMDKAMADEQFSLSREANQILQENGVDCAELRAATLPFDEILSGQDDLEERLSQWNESHVAIAREQGKKFPELSEAIEKFLAEEQEMKGKIEQAAAEMKASQNSLRQSPQEMELALKMKQMLEKVGEQAGHGGFVVPMLKSENDKKEFEEMAKKEVLDERLRPISGLTFALTSLTPTQQVLSLKAKLKPIGYDVFCVGERKFSKTFNSVEAYRKYQKENGLPRHIIGNILPDEDPEFIVVDSNEPTAEGFMLWYNEPSVRVFDYDPARPHESKNFFLLPGQTIERVGDKENKRWMAKSPLTIKLTGSQGIGFVSKLVEPDRVISAVGTNGTNYGVSNAMVARQVQTWHKEFGVELVNLGADRFTMSLKNKPKDLSKFLTDAWVFDPDLFEMYGPGHPKENAANVREFANRFEKTGLLQFWWD